MDILKIFIKTFAWVIFIMVVFTQLTTVNVALGVVGTVTITALMLNDLFIKA